eukprot:728779-Amphidinium_carterae.1
MREPHNEKGTTRIAGTPQNCLPAQYQTHHTSPGRLDEVGCSKIHKDVIWNHQIEATLEV